MTELLHTEEPLFINLGYVRPLFDYLQSQQVPIEPLLDLLGIEGGQLLAQDLRLADSIIDPLVECARRITGDVNIGLHAGAKMHVAHLGILGHLILTTGSVRQVLELHTRYQSLVGNGGISRYEFGEDSFLLRFSRAEGAPAYSRNVYEFNLAGWMSALRSLSGLPIAPLRVEFPVQAPADCSEQEQFFACPVRYTGTGDMLVYYPNSLLALTGQTGDPALHSTLELAARERLLQLEACQQDRDPLLTRLREFIGEALVHGAPPIEQAAACTDLSVRQLQRRLEQAGTSYKELVDQVRRELAGHYMRDQAKSLVDVALMLGFSEQSSFQRAFKRWFDCTPGEYRRQLSSA